MTKPTKSPERPAKTQISLGTHVLTDNQLSYQLFCLAIMNMHEDCRMTKDQVQMDA